MDSKDLPGTHHSFRNDGTMVKLRPLDTLYENMDNEVRVVFLAFRNAKLRDVFRNA